MKHGALREIFSEIASLAGIGIAVLGLIALLGWAINYADRSEGLPGGAAEFHGYPCTNDCSGHEAGHRWAEDSGITDPGDCGGNPQSFIEGCKAWAEENE